MGIFSRYGVFPLRIGDLAFLQVHSSAIEFANTKSEPIIGGLVDRSDVITSHADPVVRFATCSIDDVFNPAGGEDLLVDGYAADTGASSPTAQTLINLAIRLDGGVFDAVGNATHQTYTNEKGFLYIDSLTASQDDPMGAVCNMAYHPLSLTGEATDIPLVRTTATLTLTPTYDKTWYLGDAYIGTITGTGPTWTATNQIVGIQSLTVNSGISYSIKRGSGDAFACVGSIVERRPTIQFTTCDLAGLITADASFAQGFGGDIDSGTKFQFWLREGLSGGRRAADATSQSLIIYVSTGDCTKDTVNVQQTGDAEYTVTVRPTGSGGLAFAHNEIIP